SRSRRTARRAGPSHGRRGARETACGAWSCAASASGVTARRLRRALRLRLGLRLGPRLGRRPRRRVDGGRLRGLVGGRGVRLGRRSGAALAVARRATLAALAATPAPAGTAALLHEAEAFAVLAAAAAALAGGAEALRVRAAPAARAVGLRDALAPDRPRVPLRHDLALVDPYLDADAAVGRLRLGKAVVDVGTDRVERDAALRVALAAAHLATAEPTAALDLDALGARAHRRRERALHRAPERHAVLELLGDRLRDQLRVQLGALDLVDVDVDGLAGDRVELLAKRVHLDARLADHDARAGGVDVHGDPLLVLADQDVGQPRVRELAVDVVADPDVLEDVVGDLLLARPPVGLPVVHDADPEAAGVHLLAHYAATSCFFLLREAFGFASLGAADSTVSGALVACGRVRRGSSTAATTTVMWQVRFLIRFTRPRARARQRLSVGPSSAYASSTTSSSPSRPCADSALATAEASTRSISRAAARGVNASTVRASGTVRPRIRSSTSRALRADMRTHRACARTVIGVSVVAAISASSPGPAGR